MEIRMSVYPVLTPTNFPVAHYQTHGWCRSNAVCSPEACDALRKYAYEALEESLNLIENENENPTLHFGAIAPPSGAVLNRWNLLLRLDPAVVVCLQGLIASMGGFIDATVTQQGALADLSMLISHLGSRNQRLHFDTACSPVQPAACLVTFFVALQDVTDDMGPTVMVSDTNNPTRHADWLALTTDEQREEYSQAHKADTQRCVMKKGDCFVMDSRLLHYGSANESENRLLFCVSFKHPEHKPKGCTHCIRAELKGKYSVEDCVNLSVDS